MNSALRSLLVFSFFSAFILTGAGCWPWRKKAEAPAVTSQVTVPAPESSASTSTPILPGALDAPPLSVTSSEPTPTPSAGNTSTPSLPPTSTIEGNGSVSTSTDSGSEVDGKSDE